MGDALDDHEDGNGGKRVSAHERAKAKRRQVRQVVTYWMSIPAVSKVAIRTPSVSRRYVELGQKVRKGRRTLYISP